MHVMGVGWVSVAVIGSALLEALKEYVTLQFTGRKIGMGIFDRHGAY